jgi:hypothetical protein
MIAMASSEVPGMQVLSFKLVALDGREQREGNYYGRFRERPLPGAYQDGQATLRRSGRKARRGELP